MIYVYVFLTLFLSMDAGLRMLANLTHIRSKRALHRKKKTYIKGEVW
jgi:hypothetical protein